MLAVLLGHRESGEPQDKAITVLEGRILGQVATWVIVECKFLDQISD
jgi:hypothetical protein